jgi:hypothetical protein
MAVTSLALLCVAFLPLVTMTDQSSAATASFDAWHSYGSCGILIALAGVGLWTVARFKTIPLSPTRNWAVIAGGIILLGTALVFVRGVTYTSENVSIAADVFGGVSLGTALFWCLGAVSQPPFRCLVAPLTARCTG